MKRIILSATVAIVAISMQSFAQPQQRETKADPGRTQGTNCGGHRESDGRGGKGKEGSSREGGSKGETRSKEYPGRER